MKRILFVLMIVLNAGMAMAQGSAALWKKVDRAQADGKPQTAVGYLDKLEKAAAGDTLELYYIAVIKSEEMRKYDWRSANEYESNVRYPLYRALFGNLNKSIKKYEGHPREIILLYEKLIQQKQQVDRKYTGRTGYDYELVRKECQKLLKKYPKGPYSDRIRSILADMDASIVNVAGKGQTAPSANVVFDVSVKNVPMLSVAVFRLHDNVWFEQNYSLSEADKTAALKKHGTLTWSSRYDSIINEYNIYENLKVPVNLSEEGVYVVCFNYGSTKAYVNVDVSRTVAAIREMEGRPQIYAADIESGKPLSEYNVSQLPSEPSFDKDGFCVFKPLETVVITQDGFTDLPFDRERSRLVRAEAGGISSPAISIYGSYSRPNTYHDFGPHVIFTDRTLYGPTDTIWFKIIKFSTSLNGLVGKVIANSPVKVQLKYEREYQPLAECALTTNEMGSASGFFTLPEGSKNGNYRLCVDDYVINTVRVEEYIRPDFSLTLDGQTEVYCFNDIVKQKGTFSSLAGYNVAGAKVAYEIYQNSASHNGRAWYYIPREKVADGSTVTDGDGRFEIAFAAKTPELKDEKQVVSYEIEVKVTDAQGETHKKNSRIYVSDYPLDLNVNMVKGTFGYAGADAKVVTTDVVNKSAAANFTPVVTNLTGVPQNFCGSYTLTRDGKVAQEGSFTSGEETRCDFSKLASGFYTMTFSVPYRGRVIEDKTEFFLVGEKDAEIPLGADFFFLKLEGNDNIRFLIGTSRNDLYLEMEVFADGRRVSRAPLHLSRELSLVEMPYEASYGTSAGLSLFGICRGGIIDRKEYFTRPELHDIDVEITSLRDKTKPDTEESMTIKAPAGAELVVSIFDVTTERYKSNNYSFKPLGTVSYPSIPGVTTTLNSYGRIMVRGTRVKETAKGVANATADMAVVEEDAIPFQLAEKPEAEETTAEAPELRSDKSELIAFRPHILVPESGEAVVNFKTGGLMSTFRVNVLGHTKELFTGNATKTFIVQKDVMVKPSLPLFAREGDKITLRGKVVNLSAEAFSGTGSVELFDADSGKPLKLAGVSPVKLALAAGQQGEIAWTITIPNSVKKLGVKMWYKAGKWSDGEQNVIAVEPAKIVLTEAASFVMGGAKGHKYYESQLRKQFPVANPKIKYAEYSTLDAVKESLPEQVEPEHDNMIEWLNAYYINQMRIKVVDPNAKGGDFARLTKFQNSDGGFCWFSQMNSSETLTLLFLERVAQLRDFGAIEMGADELAAVRRAITFIDSRIKEGYASISVCCIRSRWMSEAFGERASEIFKKKLSDTEEGWQNLSILEKANLILTLQNCKGTQYWKDSFGKRIDKLAESLADYAVKNETVGVYFPNAVMPFRGLMNSEIYAHARLIDVFSRLNEKKMVDGIAQWLLLQKHNQAWENTVATTDAVHALLSSGAKDLKLGAVYYTYETTLDKVKPSSNEIQIERAFLASDGSPLAEGQQLRLGDIVRVRYTIENSENRSFVQLKAMRPACFYPKDERSGFSWSWCPGGHYREVKPSETNFFFELLPEGKTVVEETFYVTQTGRFTAGLGTIECLYAPEYRAHTASKVYSIID